MSMDDRHDDERDELRARLDALPRELEPARELWPDIATRLGGVVPLASARPARSSRAPMMVGLLAAAAAVALWWGSASVTTESTAPTVATTEVDPTPAPAPTQPGPAEASAPADELMPGEAEYRAAANLLVDTMAERRDQLPGEVSRVFDENVAVVDRAIADSRAALSRNPDDDELRQLLDDAYRSKLDLLQQIAAIPVRS